MKYTNEINLKKMRLFKGLTREKVSQMTGISKDCIRRLEHGESEKMQNKSIMRLANAYGVNREEIINSYEITKKESSLNGK